MFERFFGSRETQTGTTTDIDVVQAQRLTQEGAQLIDVREPSEFASGHAKGARNIPLGQIGTRMKDIRTDGIVLLICQSGSRSKAAYGLLKREHVADVRNVKGGTSAWRAAKLPLE